MYNKGLISLIIGRGVVGRQIGGYAIGDDSSIELGMYGTLSNVVL